MKPLNALMITVKRMALREQKPFVMGFTYFWHKKNRVLAALPRHANTLLHQTKKV